MERETERYDRFNRALMCFGVDGYGEEDTFPTLYMMTMDRTYQTRARNFNKTSIRWDVSPRLIERMRVRENEPTVQLAMALVRNAKSR